MTVKVLEFTHEVKVSPTGAERGSNTYELLEDYQCKVQVSRRSYVIVVPAGFTFDGASVPRLLWTLSGITPSGAHMAAALVHDYLYVQNGEVAEYTFSRDQVDRIFYQSLSFLAVNSWKAWIAYKAVDWLGWLVWNK